MRPSVAGLRASEAAAYSKQSVACPQSWSDEAYLPLASGTRFKRPPVASSTVSLRAVGVGLNGISAAAEGGSSGHSMSGTLLTHGKLNLGEVLASGRTD
jgi:hypothetical protein